MSVGFKFFNVANVSKLYVQNVTSGSIRNKQTKIDSK